MIEDQAPELSVASKNYGRLYHMPETDITNINHNDDASVKEAIINGDLMPSITNVIAVKNSPFLMPWATRLVAQEAVNIAQKWPQKLTQEPSKSIAYLKETANRERDFWGNQGSRIHYACEMIARGEEIDLSEYTDYEKASIAEWRHWVKEFSPKFIAMERTGFGTTPQGLNYAGTSDFIAEINGKTVIGDYKCVTNDTLVTLADGSKVKAKYLIPGDRVVAWEEEKGLHPREVTYVGDNGVKPIIKITTELGQELECTTNHPILISRRNTPKEWVQAENVRVGDVAYTSVGWGLTPDRETQEWPLPNGLSPYVYGVLWCLYNMRGGLEVDSVFRLPKVSTQGLRDELKDLGFRANKKGHIIAKHGLEKIARKAKWTPQQVVESLTEEIPDFVYTADRTAQEAFLHGVNEVFRNREICSDGIIVVHKHKKSLISLVELYLSLGLIAYQKQDPQTGLLYAKLPFMNWETIYAYGPHPVKIVSVEHLAPQPTVAVEVEGAHTHVTSGLITHNTNRSGLHSEIALQLAANVNADFITMDNQTTQPMIPVDMAVGVHISPKGVIVKEVDVSDEMYKYFCSLRHAWNYAMFEGKLYTNDGVFVREILNKDEI